MKKILFTLLALASFAHANDGAYYMSGNQLIPTEKMNIDVRKEVLDIRRVEIGNHEEDIIVSVHYELENLGEAQSVIVGFEALPANGDANSCPENGEHPYMREFRVTMNGQALDYKVATVPLEKYNAHKKEQPPIYLKNKQIQDAKVPDNCKSDNMDIYENMGMFVYYFNADFKKGKNVIEHNYRFKASGSVTFPYNFDYVLSAINRWGDSKIDDFQLTIDMGKMSEFSIKNTFFDSEDDWTLDGKIKAYPTPKAWNYFRDDADRPEKSTTFTVYNGTIHFKKINFTPKGEILLYATPHTTFLEFAGEVFDAKKDDLALLGLGNMHHSIFGDDAEKLSNFSKKVLRNHPFAQRGYVFKSPEIQAYYDRQPWYIRDENYKIDMSELNEWEKKAIEKLKGQKEGKSSNDKSDVKKPFAGKVFDAKKDNLPLINSGKMYLNLFGEDTKKLSAFSKKVLRNYPFAKRGYIFKSPKIQAYYDKQSWYSRDKNYKIDMSELSAWEKEAIEKLK